MTASPAATPPQQAEPDQVGTIGLWPAVWHRVEWSRPFATADEYRAWTDAGKPPECDCPDHHASS